MYFEKPGRENTKKAADEAICYAKQKGINYIVVASNTGETAEHFIGSGLNVVIVTHVDGFVEKGKNEMTYEKKKYLESMEMKVVTAAHALSGVERSMSRKFGGIYPIEVMANTLRMFGQGVKVCVEISVMALDSGAIPYGQEIVAVGGTGRGADTAVVIKPDYSSDIFSTRICEVICKPRI